MSELASRALATTISSGECGFTIATIHQARAWGTEGHRIVAEIAEQYLQPATARQVRELLAIDDETTLADVANWADQIRRQRRDTAPWHFVDIPIHPAPGTPAVYDPARDCHRGDCVVAKIDQFAAELRDRRLPGPQRLEALKFLVHFIGDVHEPFMPPTMAPGGNEIRVEFMGHRTNLHAVWTRPFWRQSSVEMNEAMHWSSCTRSRQPRSTTRRVGSAADWANESYRVARQVIYGQLPHEPGALPEGYERAALPVVNEQLEKAGVRLAAVNQNKPLRIVPPLQIQCGKEKSQCDN